jgi:hypothetical protein
MESFLGDLTWFSMICRGQVRRGGEQEKDRWSIPYRHRVSAEA